MEGNLSGRNMIPTGSYGLFDLQGSMHLHHQQNPHILLQRHSHHQGVAHIPIREVFPLSAGNVHECDQLLSLVDADKGDRGKTYTSDDEERSLTEDGTDGNNEVGKGKKASLWQRMKWTDGMVRLLITIVSYLGEDSLSECGSGGRRKSLVLQKKGKWKLVSKVMAERGCYVSPQQCEDKFNDLNKRYKRLTDVLGRGTSCKVVANPALLDMMDHLSEKAKEDVRKLLNSKHLYYEEMCSYHNRNRLYLPSDPALHRSLQLALRSEDDHDGRRLTHNDMDEDEQEAETDDRNDEVEQSNTSHGDNGATTGMVCFPKRMKQGHDPEDANFGNPTTIQDRNRTPNPQSAQSDMNHAFPEGPKAVWLQSQWTRSCSLQLEEQKLNIEVQMLELEKQRFKWERLSRKKDRELDKLRMENERMRHENEQMALELKLTALDACQYR